MRIATWNLNNRVGKVAFRLEAAAASAALNVDLIAFNEFFPRLREKPFRDALREAGFVHQLMSPAPEGALVNRVLMASREPLEPVDLLVPADDLHLPANVLGARVIGRNLSVVALRVPAYKAADALLLSNAWAWLERATTSLASCPAIVMGDFNVSTSTRSSVAGRQFQKILESGWARASFQGATFFGSGGARSEIDHVLASKSCSTSNGEVVLSREGFSLAGSVSSISDHAALVCDVSVLSDGIC